MESLSFHLGNGKLPPTEEDRQLPKSLLDLALHARPMKGNGVLQSHLGPRAADDRSHLVGSIAHTCSEEARAAWNGGLNAFARPSSQRVGPGHAETLSHCSSQDAPRG